MASLVREHVAIAAREHDRERWVVAANDLAELDAVHAGHDDIGEDDIGARGIGREQIERLRGIRGPGRREAEVLEDLVGEAPDLDIVLDDEDVQAYFSAS